MARDGTHVEGKPRAPGEASPNAARCGMVLDGKLRLVKLVGSGGMADVFEAEHLSFRLRVAVKVLRDGRGQASTERRFMREARIAARLSTAHAVRVFDVGRSQHGMPYMVMELLDGETLKALIARPEPIAVPDAAEYAVQAAEALAEMHAARIIHRDVKPSNLFLVRDGDQFRVKLIDFGVASWAETGEGPRLTHTDIQIGTPTYMAPEQFESSRDVDARADVWSLGVTLYQMLSGKLPFDSRNAGVLAHQIVKVEPRPLGELRPELPPGLVALVHKSIAKDPELRQGSMEELAAELAPFRAGRSSVDAASRPSPSRELATQQRAPIPLRTRAIAKARSKLRRFARSLLASLGVAPAPWSYAVLAAGVMVFSFSVALAAVSLLRPTGVPVPRAAQVTLDAVVPAVPLPAPPASPPIEHPVVGPPSDAIVAVARAEAPAVRSIRAPRSAPRSRVGSAKGASPRAPPPRAGDPSGNSAHDDAVE